MIYKHPYLSFGVVIIVILGIVFVSQSNIIEVCDIFKITPKDIKKERNEEDSVTHLPLPPSPPTKDTTSPRKPKPETGNWEKEPENRSPLQKEILKGTVLSTTNRPLPGVIVRCVSLCKDEAETITDKNGQFSLELNIIGINDIDQVKLCFIYKGVEKCSYAHYQNLSSINIPKFDET